MTYLTPGPARTAAGNRQKSRGLARIALTLPLVVLPLLACQHARPVSGLGYGLPLPPGPPPYPPPPLPARPPPVTLTWTFAQSADECLARAANDATALRVVVNRGSTIAIQIVFDRSVSLPTIGGLHVSLWFTGTAGSWGAGGAIVSRNRVVAMLPLNDLSVARVLLLLGGGSLNVAAQPSLPMLRVIPSDMEGQKWFACVQRMLV